MYGNLVAERLTKSAWIRYGLAVLSEQGIEAIKVLPLAKALNVSRGSFYWHFADLTDYRSELLKGWQEVTTDRVILDLATQAGNDRLKLLMGRAFVNDRGLEQAVRYWASQDSAVAAVVATVDAQRIAYIEQLLLKAGLEAKRAKGRAIFIYWAYLGQAAISAGVNSLIDAKVMNELASLLEI